MAIFCLRLSLLVVRPGRASGCVADRLAEGVEPRGLEDEDEDEGMAGSDCEAPAAACAEAMDDDEFLGRAVASGEGGRVWFIAAGAWGRGGEATGRGRGRGRGRGQVKGTSGAARSSRQR